MAQPGHFLIVEARIRPKRLVHGLRTLALPWLWPRCISSDMYIREVVSKRKHGPDVTYVQLCESEWDAKRGSAKTRILHSFGRKDGLDLRQMARLQAQLAAYL